MEKITSKEALQAKLCSCTDALRDKFEGADGKTATGAGKLGASATGKTGSSVRFFDNQGQFEAYIDEILMSVAK